MSASSKIEWTDRTWNPTVGCAIVSPGCDHCYAKVMHERFNGPGSFETITLHHDRLRQPLRWRKPARVFVNSMSDLFHKDVADEYIARVWATMALAPWHTFQLLTKRHGRMRSLLSSPDWHDRVYEAGCDHLDLNGDAADRLHRALNGGPLPNVWGGVSVESRQWTIRLDALAETPFAVRWVSAEPLLSGLDLTPYMSWLDWVVVGGESGAGARPMHPQWARDLRDQCAEAGVPFLFKQRGAWTWNEPGHFRVPTAPFTDRVGVMHAGGMVALTKSNPFDPFAVHHPNWATRIERVGKGRAGRELDGCIHDGYPGAS